MITFHSPLRMASWACRVALGRQGAGEESHAAAQGFKQLLRALVMLPCQHLRGGHQRRLHAAACRP